ncbi:MAG: hypothetical protein K8S21_06670 [Gemmatimonadetes bacterium]|nr:hypothetical protein [Gemmatimonadota bacterium]
MSNDDQFEAFLEREARRLNEPPAEVPREAMWEAIAAARVARPTVEARPITTERPRLSVRSTPWIGMAAMLVLGLGIGRYMLAREMGTVPAVDSLAVAAATAMTTRGATPASGALPGTAGLGDPAAPVASPRVGAVRPPSSTRSGSRAPAPSPDAFAQRHGSSATYSEASQQHLTRAEALVAVVSAMPADAALDSLTGRWARDILTNTRLLLDSPAGDDPVRRRLLEDLETVLVQLVQRSGRTIEDRAMIDRTLQKTQLLTRLRSGATGT